MASATGTRATRRRRRGLSPLTLRLLAVNVFALLMLIGGVLYLNRYQTSLVASELSELRTLAETFGAALGESAIDVTNTGQQSLDLTDAKALVERLTETSHLHARLFDHEGELISDSRADDKIKEVIVRDVEQEDGAILRQVLVVYEEIIDDVSGADELPIYPEVDRPTLETFPSLRTALAGSTVSMVLRHPVRDERVLTVAVPVRRYRRVMGALLLASQDHGIEESMEAVREDILVVSAIALVVSVALSLYFARTIARPLRRLALAAETVRHGRGRDVDIPDLTRRHDEIGELSGALSDMTRALRARMDAIERFAADVAHELKNPLSSLRSAMETAARIEDPERRARLFAIVEDDIRRMDRLISDISAASRIDSEMSRAPTETMDLADLVTAVAAVHDDTSDAGAPRLVRDLPRAGNCLVAGVEDRLVQVLRNLIDNAASFSPPNGVIALTLTCDRQWATLTVDDEGPGIPAAKLDAIFDRFYSSRPEGEQFGTHSGLGLSICRQIVQGHGGTIHAENRTDGGARFVVRLPRA